MQKIIAAGAAAVTLLGGQAQAASHANLTQTLHRLDQVARQACWIYKQTAYVQAKPDPKNPKFNYIAARKTELSSPALAACTVSSGNDTDIVEVNKAVANLDYLLRVIDANTSMVEIQRNPGSGRNYVMAHDGQIPDPAKVKASTLGNNSPAVLRQMTARLQQKTCALGVRTELLQTIDVPAVGFTPQRNYRPGFRVILAKTGPIRNAGKVCGRLEPK